MNDQDKLSKRQTTLKQLDPGAFKTNCKPISVASSNPKKSAPRIFRQIQ